jgi:hypothetical protein
MTKNLCRNARKSSKEEFCGDSAVVDDEGENLMSRNSARKPLTITAVFEEMMHEISVKIPSMKRPPPKP